MKSLVCRVLATLLFSGVALAQAPTVGQYELLTNQSWLSLSGNSISVGAQLGYQYQPDWYLAANLGFASSEEWGSSFRVAPLVEYVLPQAIGMTAAVQLTNDGLHWWRARVFYRQYLDQARLDYFAEYQRSEFWQDMNLGVASKYYLAANFSLNADGYLQWAFADWQEDTIIRPVVGTGFSFFF